MDFYGRETELEVLRAAAKLSQTTSQFTVVLGRRRVGKTTLMLKGAEGTKSVYLFVSRKSEPVLCADLQRTVTESGIEIVGRIERFGDLFKALMLHSVHEPITVMIDEFQNLAYVDDSIFGSIQEVWDLLKDRAHINLIVSGSVHSLMVRIFEDSKEPLFNRSTRKVEVRPFPVGILKRILADHCHSYGNRDLLTLYMLTGGVPWYVELLMDAGAVTRERMMDFALSPGSVFLREGDDLMTAEFGKDNKVYLSLLQLMASGVNRRSELEDTLKVTLGEYLRRLEGEYALITRELPMFTEDPRLGRWVMTDMYLAFYYRYIQPNEGRVLESYLRKKISEEWEYTAIGGYWNRNGDIEIDVVVQDSVERRVELIEVKRNPDKLDMGKLAEKASDKNLKSYLKGCTVGLRGMSMEDM